MIEYLLTSPMSFPLYYPHWTSCTLALMFLWCENLLNSLMETIPLIVNFLKRPPLATLSEILTVLLPPSLTYLIFNIYHCLTSEIFVYTCTHLFFFLSLLCNKLSESWTFVFFSLLHLQCLEQNIVHRRCTINID